MFLFHAPNSSTLWTALVALYDWESCGLKKEMRFPVGN